MLTGANAGAVAAGAGAGAWMAKLDGLTLGTDWFDLPDSLTAMPAKWPQVTEGPLKPQRHSARNGGVAHLAPAQVHSWRARNKEETAKPPRVCYTPLTQTGSCGTRGIPRLRSGMGICLRRAMGSPRPSQVAWKQAGWLDPVVPVCLSPVLHLAPNGGASLFTHPSESENCLCLCGCSDDDTGKNCAWDF